MDASTMFGAAAGGVPRHSRAVRQAARQLHRRRHGRTTEFRAARGRPDRRPSISPLRGRFPRGDVLEAVRDRVAAVQRAGRPHRLWVAAPAALLAPQPAEVRGGEPGLIVQHGRELRHQYQLAGLLRRIDDGVSRADGGPRGAEFSVGRDRHRGRHRADPRLRAAHAHDDRQLLGGRHARDALRAAAASRRARARARRARA